MAAPHGAPLRVYLLTLFIWLRPVSVPIAEYNQLKPIQAEWSLNGPNARPYASRSGAWLTSLPPVAVGWVWIVTR